MTHQNTPPTLVSPTDREALAEVFRRLGAAHASLAEAPRLDEDLHRWTLDRLMDIIEYIDATGALEERR